MRRHWLKRRSRPCATGGSRLFPRRGRRRGSTGWRISSLGACHGSCGGGIGFRLGTQPTNEFRMVSSLHPMKKVHSPSHASSSAKTQKSALAKWVSKLVLPTRVRSRSAVIQTSSTPGSPPRSGPSLRSAGPAHQNKTPLTLSLSKGCPFLRAHRNKTVLRQAQHERVWGAGKLACSPATTPTTC